MNKLVLLGLISFSGSFFVMGADKATLQKKEEFKCRSRDCSEEFSDRMSLRAHERQQHEITACNFCEQFFLQKKPWRLRKHMINCHPEQLTYHCEFPGCGMSFEHRDGLATHKGVKRHGFYSAPVAAASLAPVAALVGASQPSLMLQKCPLCPNDITNSQFAVCDSCLNPNLAPVAAALYAPMSALVAVMENREQPQAVLPPVPAAAASVHQYEHELVLAPPFMPSSYQEFVSPVASAAYQICPRCNKELKECTSQYGSKCFNCFVTEMTASRFSSSQQSLAPVAVALPALAPALVGASQSLNFKCPLCPNDITNPTDLLCGTCLIKPNILTDPQPKATEEALASFAVAAALAAAPLDHSLQPNTVDSRCPRCNGIGAHLCLPPSLPVQDQESILLASDEDEEGQEMEDVAFVSSVTSQEVQRSAPMKEAEKQLREFPCDRCTESYRYRSSLIEHQINIHNDKKEFQCRIKRCSRTFDTKDLLTDHQRNEHENFLCSVKGCEKFFLTVNSLSSHNRKHNIAQSPFRCKTSGCKRCFSTFNDFRAHQDETGHCNV